MLSLKEWNESREATRMHGEVDLGTLQKLTERNEALQQQVHEEQLARCVCVCVCACVRACVCPSHIYTYVTL